MRNNEGYLNLEGYKKTSNYVKGRKEKVWLKQNSKLFLFKTGASYYEDYAELIASELGKQFNLTMAEYDLAIYEGKKGVITPSFLNEGEIIYSGDSLIKFVATMMQENNICTNCYKNHSITSIINSLHFLDNVKPKGQIKKDLIKLWIFDGLIMESDRNITNWSLIYKANGIFKLSPIYDCSTMARMNNDINSFVSKLYNYSDIGKITEGIKQSLHLNSFNKSEYFLDQFAYFCECENYDLATLKKDILNIDVKSAIKNVEEKISKDLKNNFLFEYNMKIWLEKSIEYRKNEILFIIEKNYIDIEKQSIKKVKVLKK